MAKSSGDSSSERPGESYPKKNEICQYLGANRLSIESGETVVYCLDESHLVWGDTCGYTWGKTDTRVQIPISNLKQRQTYYGAINYRTGQTITKAYAKGDSVNTIKFIETLRKINPSQKLILIWDGAAYHNSQEFRNYLNQVNGDKPEHDWSIYCIKLAPYAPEQNPIEAVWLQAKNFLRRVWHLCKTFKTVKWLFQWFIEHFVLRSAQLSMYGVFS